MENQRVPELYTKKKNPGMVTISECNMVNERYWMALIYRLLSI